jgi:hypothetical protein
VLYPSDFTRTLICKKYKKIKFMRQWKTYRHSIKKVILNKQELGPDLWILRVVQQRQPGKRQKLAEDDAVSCILGPDKSAACRKSCARLIQKIGACPGESREGRSALLPKMPGDHADHRFDIPDAFSYRQVVAESKFLSINATR